MAELRAMYMSDLPKVLRIIAATEEEDAEAAEEEFHDEGLDNQYVLELNDKVIGVSGFRPVPSTDASYWLSWTYLAPEHQGAGYGRRMLEQTLQHLRELEARILFVKVSDYVNESGAAIYQVARSLYESLGFTSELVSQDFYDDGESQHILCLRMAAQQEAEADTEPADLEVQDEKPVIRFNGLHEIAETDGAYTFEWIVEESTKLFGKRSFSEQDLMIGLQAVKNNNGRKVFLTFPSNLPLIHKPLQAAGFKFVGQLTNYYECGVHELHFVHDLDGV